MISQGKYPWCLLLRASGAGVIPVLWELAPCQAGQDLLRHSTGTTHHRLLPHLLAWFINKLNLFCSWPWQCVGNTKFWLIFGRIRECHLKKTPQDHSYRFVCKVTRMGTKNTGRSRVVVGGEFLLIHPWHTQKGIGPSGCQLNSWCVKVPTRSGWQSKKY